MESFFSPSVLNPDYACMEAYYRDDIKFSNLISFREEVKYTLFVAVNCPKKGLLCVCQSLLAVRTILSLLV